MKFDITPTAFCLTVGSMYRLLQETAMLLTAFYRVVGVQSDMLSKKGVGIFRIYIYHATWQYRLLFDGS